MMTSLIRQARLRGPHPGVAPKDRVAHVMRARLRLFSLVAAASLLLFLLVDATIWLVRIVGPVAVAWYTPQFRLLRPLRTPDIIHDVVTTAGIVLCFYILGAAAGIMRRRALPDDVRLRMLLPQAARGIAAVALFASVFDVVQTAVSPHSRLVGGLLSLIVAVPLHLVYMVTALDVSLRKASTSRRQAVTDDAYRRSGREVTHPATRYSPGIIQAMGLDDEELATEIAYHKEILHLLEEEQEARRAANAKLHRNAR